MNFRNCEINLFTDGTRSDLTTDQQRGSGLVTIKTQRELRKGIYLMPMSVKNTQEEKNIKVNANLNQR